MKPDPKHITDLRLNCANAFMRGPPPPRTRVHQPPVFLSSSEGQGGALAKAATCSPLSTPRPDLNRSRSAGSGTPVAARRGACRGPCVSLNRGELRLFRCGPRLAPRSGHRRGGGQRRRRRHRPGCWDRVVALCDSEAGPSAPRCRAAASPSPTMSRSPRGACRSPADRAAQPAPRRAVVGRLDHRAAGGSAIWPCSSPHGRARVTDRRQRRARPRARRAGRAEIVTDRGRRPLRPRPRAPAGRR